METEDCKKKWYTEKRDTEKKREKEKFIIKLDVRRDRKRRNEVKK